MIDIPDIRRRCHNAITNTHIGKHLGQALDELQMMRDREQTIRAGRAVSTNLLEIACEQRDPAKWAAMMIVKGGNPQMNSDEAMELIEGTLRHALELMLDHERQKCDAARLRAAENFLKDFAS